MCGPSSFQAQRSLGPTPLRWALWSRGHSAPVLHPPCTTYLTGHHDPAAVLQAFSRVLPRSISSTGGPTHKQQPLSTPTHVECPVRPLSSLQILRTEKPPIMAAPPTALTSGPHQKHNWSRTRRQAFHASRRGPVPLWHNLQ
ncbi:hypothetical protein NDU88_001969 [Pleurodeles waltl]|uniref:Uncharacterized protein n=1 Tax=Pleurodeles waltl TaxID=8319 RepID=A0AAV7W1L5_PLEWA|nr:hypothetical protein NDU88_001969 [Pleurodeles waltl]